jgi:hypothetical protein
MNQFVWHVDCFLERVNKPTDSVLKFEKKKMHIKYVKLEGNRKVKLTSGAGNIFVEVFFPVSNTVERAKMSVAINIYNEQFIN